LLDEIFKIHKLGELLFCKVIDCSKKGRSPIWGSYIVMPCGIQQQMQQQAHSVK